MPVKAVILDMDGVIFDSEAAFRDATLLLNPQYCIQFDEAYRQTLCGMGEAGIREKLQKDFPNADIPAYRKAISKEVTRRAQQGIPMKEGFIPLMELCKEKGIKTALATSNTRIRAEMLFGSHSLSLDMFDACIFGSDVTRSKPDPEIFLTAASRLGVNPNECIVVEDSINGLKAARSGGFRPLMVVDLIQPQPWIEEAGIPVLGSLGDVVQIINDC